MFATFLLQNQVGRLSTGMMNLCKGPGMNDLKTNPVKPKQIHHLETAWKYSSLRQIGNPTITRFATPQTAFRNASTTKTSLHPSPTSSPFVKCKSKAYLISSKISGTQALICRVRSRRMTVKSWMKALLGPEASHSNARISSCALVAAIAVSGCWASQAALLGGRTTDGQWREGRTKGRFLLLYCFG